MNDSQIQKNKIKKYLQSTAFLTSHLPLYCVVLSICTFLLHPNDRVRAVILLVIDAILVFGIAAGGFFTIKRKELTRPGVKSTVGLPAVILGIIALVVFTIMGIMLFCRAILILIGMGTYDW